MAHAARHVDRRAVNAVEVVELCTSSPPNFTSLLSFTHIYISPLNVVRLLQSHLSFSLYATFHLFDTITTSTSFEMLKSLVLLSVLGESAFPPLDKLPTW